MPKLGEKLLRIHQACSPRFSSRWRERAIASCSFCCGNALASLRRVEVALQWVFQVDQLQKMAPCQLSRQCRDNLGVGVSLGKAQHVAQVFTGEYTPVVGLQCLASVGTISPPYSARSPCNTSLRLRWELGGGRGGADGARPRQDRTIAAPDCQFDASGSFAKLGRHHFKNLPLLTVKNL